MATVYLFSNAIGRSECCGFALADDGVMLATEWCSCDDYVRRDLGGYEYTRADLREKYAAHFPQGYQIVYVPWRNVIHHAGLQAAIALHRKQEAVLV
jgi:hypothetical protein